MVSYGERAVDDQVGRETFVGQRNDNISWLNGRIVEVRSRLLKKFKYEIQIRFV